MKISTCLDRFLNYLQYEKRFSNHTVVAYKNDLSHFISYLQSTYNLDSIEDINPIIIRSWVVSLMENKITPRSVNRKITSLKSFYKLLLREQVVLTNPLLKIQSPKTAKKLPVFIEKKNMDTLLDTIEFGDDFKGHRNKLIIELFYATGMRLSELINLKQTDIDLTTCQLKVLGKRNKERIIPFNKELKRQLENYMHSKADFKDEHFFFVNDKGKKIYEKFVYRLVKNYLSLVTTVQKKSPHILRHTFATHMLDNGADLNAIKELLGHANLSATQVYTHNTVEKLKNIHKQAHPKA